MYTYIDIEVDFLVPSMAIYEIKFVDGKWIYVYRFKAPKNSKLKNGLFVYGHILQLKLVSEVSKNSINIQVNCIDDLKKLLELQREVDLEFRNKWKSEHDDYYKKCKYKEFENKTQLIKEKYNLIEMIDIMSDSTRFVIADNRYKKNKVGDE